MMRLSLPRRLIASQAGRERVGEDESEDRDQVKDRVAPGDHEQHADGDRIVESAFRAPLDAVDAAQEPEGARQPDDPGEGRGERQDRPARSKKPREGGDQQAAGEMHELAGPLDRRAEPALPPFGGGEDHEEARSDQRRPDDLAGGGAHGREGAEHRAHSTASPFTSSTRSAW